MDRLVRLSKISVYLQQGVNACELSQLAEIFNCSVRTIRRDIVTLITDFQAPFFILNNSVYPEKQGLQKMPIAGHWLTIAELNALLALNACLNQLQAGLLAKQLAPFKQHLERLLTQHNKHPRAQSEQNLSDKIKIIQMASSPLNEAVFAQIAQALASQQRLKITFWRRHNDQIIEREISPQQLIRYRDHWILDAYCHTRQAIRSFSLNGIQQACLLEHTARNVEPEALADHFETSYGIFAGQADQQAVLNFSAYQARWIQFEIWHPNQQACWLADGRYQLIIPYKHDIELTQDILKYGPEVEVIAPPELRQKVTQRLTETLKQYSSDRI